ncbi:MAG: HAD-IIA family hydrolase [Alicyclobacillus sp.]|nr:HAD-IIA family hydrolase [Alicyclobacillus sp.]
MDKHQRRTWQAALIDLDGTLYCGREVVPGAPAFVERLRRRGIRPVFLTNNSTRTPQQVADKLQAMGIEAHAAEVCSSAEATAAYLLQKYGQVTVGYLGQDGLHSALLAAGHQPVSLGTAAEERAGTAIAAVAVGLDPTADYMRLAAACDHVMRLKAFVLTNGDVRLPGEDRFWPGNGALGAFIATATGVQPYLAGKPNPDFIAFTLARYGLQRDQVLLIGDNLRTDVEAGKRAGVYTIQVLTGVQYGGAGAGTDASPDVQADEVYGSVAELFVDP